MGQKHTRARASSDISDNISPSYELNDVDATNSPLQQSQDSGSLFFCCCRHPKSMPATIDNRKWKKLMIEQLESLEIEGWPKLLSKCLKKQPMGELDKFYQNDIVWANKHSATVIKKSFSVQSVLSQHRDDGSFMMQALPNEGGDDHNSIKNLEIKNQEEAVQELLDSSHIFEEQFYHDNNKETWLNKGFDIKLQHNSVLDDSYKQNRPAQLKTSPPKKVKPYATKHIEKYKNNTFVNQLPKTESNADSLLQNIMRYKLVTQRIERQANQKRNVFCQMKDAFQNYFTGLYGPLIEKAKKGEIAKVQIKIHSAQATADLQQFIRIFFEGLCSFYQLDSLDAEGAQSAGKEILFNRDNLLSFTTSLIFTREIYDVIFEFYKLEEATQEESYQNKVLLCKDLQPQDFGVPEEYALNEKTVAYWIEHGKLAKPIAPIPDVIQEEENGEKREENKIEESPQRQESLSRSSIKARKSLEAYNAIAQESQPYEEAVALIANLKHRKSPIHKLKTIVRVAELITKGIERFYARFGLVNREKLDADQTLSIFLYIVTKSGIRNLNSHCKIIEKFSTNNVLNSVSGYYATTLEACVNCISNMDFTESNKTPDRMSSGIKEFVHSMVNSMKMSVERFSVLHKDGI